ncbi:MAG TPA: hypothetical protein VGL29_16035 [Blastocatellia bacterium]|jgi:hypothetical protein
MNSCREVRKLIDQSEKPDLLAFDVTEHIERCSDCERFSSERAGLRKLLASPVRVSAPVNFDAALNARLAEVKARRSLWWLSAPGYLRLGAATAGVVVMLFAAHYIGLFSKPSEPASQTGAIATGPQPPAPKAAQKRDMVPSTNERGDNSSAPPEKRIRRREVALGKRIAPPAVLATDDGGVVIVRGQNGEMDIQMPTVSVGAQPLLLVGAGRRVTPSGGRTSF